MASLLSMLSKEGGLNPWEILGPTTLVQCLGIPLIRKHKTLVAFSHFEGRMCHTGENCSDLFIGSHGRLTSIRAQGKKSLST